MASDLARAVRDGEVWSGGGTSDRTSWAYHLRALPPPRAYGVTPAPRRRAPCPPGSEMVRSAPRRGGGSPAPLRLTARGRRVVAVLLLLVVMGMAAGAGTLLGGGAEDLELMGAGSLVVGPGDTLWSIASGVAGERDVREVIGAIQRLNGLDSASIEPGQVLELP